MYRLVERRKLWFLVSLLGILPGILFILWNLSSSGTLLPLSIDYTGGTQWEMRFSEPVAPTELGSVFVEAGFTDTKAFNVDDDRTVQVKFKIIDISQKAVIEQLIVERFGEFDEQALPQHRAGHRRRSKPGGTSRCYRRLVIDFGLHRAGIQRNITPLPLRSSGNCGARSRCIDYSFIPFDYEPDRRLGAGCPLPDRDVDRHRLQRQRYDRYL